MMLVFGLIRALGHMSISSISIIYVYENYEK